MWNQLQTDAYEGMLAETVTTVGYSGESVRAYFSRPLGPGPFPGIVLIPHMPGWDEFCRETARRFSQHGYLAICPNIFQRAGEGTPSEVSAKARDMGGMSDDAVMGDVKGSRDYLASQPYSNGKVGVIGMCSGGRHAYLAACRVSGFDAAVDCWGGGVVPDDRGLSPARPVWPVNYTADLSCPLLGIFGNDDHSPTPEAVDTLEAALVQHGKDYEFHRYDGAPHAFWGYNSPNYRQEQAMDSWEKTFAFFEKHLRT